MEPIETTRLLLREIEYEDEDSLFELDSDPEVHRYVGNNPVQSKEQIRMVIGFIRQQYVDNGIGRWAVVDKNTNELLGWAGLKLFTEPVNKHNNFYELGYRFMKKYWGKGYATETAKAWVDYGLGSLKQKELFAMTDVNNLASKNVLKKSGFTFVETFNFNDEPTDWFKITR